MDNYHLVKNNNKWQLYKEGLTNLFTGKVMKITIVLIFFLINSFLNAQLITSVAPIEPGNKWFYNSTIFSQSSVLKIEVLDSIKIINGISFFSIKTIENSQTISYVTLLDDGFYARYDEMISDSLYTYFKLNPMVNDHWVQIWYDNSELQNTITDSIETNIFGENVIVYAVDRLSETAPLVSREYWTKEFGMISAQYEQASDVLLGCVINGVLYGDTTTVGIEEGVHLPDEFTLFQNYPNPFNPSTTIKYNLDKEEFVRLSIYDVLGNRIKLLVNESQHPGYYTLTWEGKNEFGKRIPSGVYFVELKVQERSQIIKVTLIK
ncbi:MAG: T9SS type A sorting domain-containing protein [Bacteroidetes bacterium]|nr:T9SS type A sorting domain-containing protein [Bacteroidota bacterium]